MKAESILRVHTLSLHDALPIYLTIANGFTNHGLIELSNVTTNCCTSTALTTKIGVQLDAADRTIDFTTGASRTLAGALDNRGTVNVGKNGLTWNNTTARSNTGT